LVALPSSSHRDAEVESSAPTYPKPDVERRWSSETGCFQAHQPWPVTDRGSPSTQQSTRLPEPGSTRLHIALRRHAILRRQTISSHKPEARGWTLEARLLSAREPQQGGVGFECTDDVCAKNALLAESRLYNEPTVGRIAYLARPPSSHDIAGCLNTGSRHCITTTASSAFDTESHDIYGLCGNTRMVVPSQGRFGVVGRLRVVTTASWWTSTCAAWSSSQPAPVAAFVAR
jgi:hypothetical protein